MTPRAIGQLSLVGVFALTAGVAFLAGRGASETVVWVLAAALLILGVVGWRSLRQVARANATANAEFAALQGQHATALARIAELTNSQGRFVGNIAHEIKTPLSIVLSLSELLLACSHDPDAVRRYARSIGADMRHLADLVDGFLRLARPFAQEDTRNHVPVCFHDFVIEAVRRSQPFAIESGVVIVTTLAESDAGVTGLEVLGDPVLLEAMLENLVRNAVRFSPRGSRVSVTVEDQGESIALFVRDRGTGIAPDQLDSVFDWFFDVPAHIRSTAGVGFGLAIAKRVAEHHHGNIILRNRAEGGCEFAVRLPRWRASAVAEAGAALP